MGGPWAVEMGEEVGPLSRDNRGQFQVGGCFVMRGVVVRAGYHLWLVVEPLN